MAKKKTFSWGTIVGNPEWGRHGLILPAWVASQNVGFAKTCLFVDSAI